MKKIQRAILFVVAFSLTGLGIGQVWNTSALFQTDVFPDYAVNLTQPYLLGDGTWSDFDETAAYESKNGLVINYQVGANFAAFPLIDNPPTTQVLLRPGADPASEITCVPHAVATGNVSTCSYQVLFNQVRIFYVGNLIAGQPIRYRVLNLESSDPGSFNIVDFDTDAAPGAVESPTPIAGRIAAQLVLVLDKSGSMGWSSTPLEPGCAISAAPPPGCEPSRWEVLNDAVTQLMAVASAYGLPVAVESFEGDDFGAAFFDGSLDTRIPAGSGFNSLDNSSIASFLSTLSGISPGGSTSIGAGMLSFDSDLSADPNFNQFVLIFSDGEQNTAPYVVVNSALGEVGTNPTANNLNTFDEYAPGVAICPFAMVGDDPTSTNIELMQSIANFRCDALTYTDVQINDEDMLTFFLNVMNETLIGDKLETAAVRNGRLPAGENRVIETFEISEGDAAFTILFRANREDVFRNGDSIFRPDLILRKDGVEFFPFREAVLYGGTTAIRGDTFVSATLHQPFCNLEQQCVDPEGTWEALFQASGSVESLDYTMVNVVDNRYLATEYTIQQPTLGVGQPLVVNVQVSDRSIPAGDAIKLAGEVIIRSPQASLGNLLVSLNLAPDLVAKLEDEFANIIEEGGDPVDGVKLIIQQLVDEGIIQEAVLPTAEERFNIEEFADEAGNVQIVTDTKVQGIYEVEIRLIGESSGDGRMFQRFHKQTVSVPVIPDPNQLILSIDDFSDSCNFVSCFEVLLLLVDDQGNFVGPGKANGIQLITSPNDQQIADQQVIDNLDGTYRLRVIYRDEPSTNPLLGIVGQQIVPLELFGGVPIYTLPTPTPQFMTPVPPTVTPFPPTITPVIPTIPPLTPPPIVTVPPVVTIPPITPDANLFWEYLIIDIDGPEEDMPETLDAVFNALAQRGWEYIGEFDGNAVFRRPRQ